MQFNTAWDFTKVGLLIFLTEHGLQDGFIVDGADEAGQYRLVQWIFDGWEVPCGCHLSDPSCQLRRCLFRLPIDDAPELESFPYCELRRVVVTRHEIRNVTEFYGIGCGGDILLRNMVGN